MKKKLFLFLLPLVMSMVGCGKDVSPNMDKVDLARLLSNDEINEALEKVKDNFANKLSTQEANMVMLEDDLVDQKSETTVSGSLKIKGDEYAESSAEMTTKVQNSFYSYTDKTVMEGKTALFGNYYVSMSESYKDGQKDNKDKTFDSLEKGEKTIVDACGSLPFSASTLQNATIGVDKRDNIYVVYSQETINTQEGHDKDGKDATFIDKNTYEISAKLGSLKDPKVESYKVVRKHEANYNKELKVYKDYQVLESTVASYKFEYKSWGKNDGKDKFISSLPEKFISNASIVVSTYAKNELNVYEVFDVDYASTSSSKIDYDSGIYTCKLNDFAMNKNYAYGFDAIYRVVTLNKSSYEITSEDKQCASFVYNANGSLDVVTTLSGSGNNSQLFKLADNYKSSVQSFSFIVRISDNSLAISII